MEKTKIIRYIFFTLMILTCIIIFIFSSQNGEESTEVSDGFISRFIDIFPLTKNQTEDQKQEIIKNLQFIVRKTAHFSIYTILGITSMEFINTYNISYKKKIGISFLIGVLYAISDEFHQLFSSGRTAKVMDVGIDSAGVIFGIFIVYVIIKLYKTLKTKTKNKKVNI